ncbi:MAG: cytosine permease [Cyanobacteria bacterium REEB67]|nr:cytosine permease [Cyanobacteria bacterium REEB67]
MTMTLLWITMVTALPTVLVGFEWYKQGLSLFQVISCSVLSSVLLLLYSLPASWMGVKSGLSYGLLARQVFGLWGTRLASFHAIWLMLAWYALDAVLLADALKGLFHLSWSAPFFSAILCMIMAINNFFGFQGVANFARYFAAPLLIAWVALTFFRAAPTCPVSALTVTHSNVSFMAAMTMVSSFVIGFGVWGNEADYWRYSKVKKSYVAWSFAFSLFVGEVIFPITGWMVARLSGITDYTAATNYMNNYSFGGIALFAALVIIANYCAANDSNMYGMINNLENIAPVKQKAGVFGLALLSAGLAYWLSTAGSAQSLTSIASLNCVILPVMTVIMFTELFIVKKYWLKDNDISAVLPLESLPPFKWPALIASSIGVCVGVVTAGVIPGLGSWLFGVCSVQAWLSGGFIYLLLRFLQVRRAAPASNAAPG